MIDFLLNYATLAVAALVFIVAVVLLITGRRKLTPTTKALLVVALFILAAYFAFVLWMVLASGNAHPIADPVPQ